MDEPREQHAQGHPGHTVHVAESDGGAQPTNFPPACTLEGRGNKRVDAASQRTQTTFRSSNYGHWCRFRGRPVTGRLQCCLHVSATRCVGQQPSHTALPLGRPGTVLREVGPPPRISRESATPSPFGRSVGTRGLTGEDALQEEPASNGGPSHHTSAPWVRRALAGGGARQQARRPRTDRILSRATATVVHARGPPIHRPASRPSRCLS